ncbi:hypothetical protein AB0J35_55350 [Nonomuraea angiospora]|uniref:TolB family protein n=1 Tax=Nonomuraea angiospora TaxID=46172 RepID=UPI0034258BFD
MTNFRTLAEGQSSQIWIGGPDPTEPQLLFETRDILVEAPNWALDGASLLVNGDGALWRLDLGHPGRGLTRVPFDGLPDLNNDHILDPDGEHIYKSAGDGHIYRGALTGGTVRRATPDDGKWHFLHGMSPDGKRLVTSDTVDWFPHLSPDARHATYLAFPAGTVGHPADLDIEVRVVASSDWSTPLRRYPLYGGQGTINVNSWSPDSRRFAFVAYPVSR